jgi:hypothetical protein
MPTLRHDLKSGSAAVTWRFMCAQLPAMSEGNAGQALDALRQHLSHAHAACKNGIAFEFDDLVQSHEAAARTLAAAGVVLIDKVFDVDSFNKAKTFAGEAIVTCLKTLSAISLDQQVS